jgi:hypothetical protein
MAICRLKIKEFGYLWFYGSFAGSGWLAEIIPMGPRAAPM